MTQLRIADETETPTEPRTPRSVLRLLFPKSAFGQDFITDLTPEELLGCINSSSWVEIPVLMFNVWCTMIWSIQPGQAIIIVMPYKEPERADNPSSD